MRSSWTQEGNDAVEGPANYKNKSIVLRRCETIGRQRSLVSVQSRCGWNCSCCGAVTAPLCGLVVVHELGVNVFTLEQTTNHLQHGHIRQLLIHTHCRKSQHKVIIQSHNTKSRYKVTTQSHITFLQEMLSAAPNGLRRHHVD